MNTAVPERAKFHHMKDGTADDWMIIGAEVQEFSKTLYQRIIDHLLLLEGDCGGFPVDRLTHCLQTATLAHKDGKDEEYVVCALCTTSATRLVQPTTRISPPFCSSLT